MKDICVTFEEWYLGDGTYPPLHTRQKVNLSFYIQPYEKSITAIEQYYFTQKKNSEYIFSGQIIRNYIDKDKSIIIVDTGDFKFYIEEFDETFKPNVGEFIYGQGQLLIDYYIWVENLDNYENPPELFYSFYVDKIRKVKIPERFIIREKNSMSSPTSLSTSDYDENDAIEIEDMRDNSINTSFFLLDLKSINENISKTFT